jgi:poly(3-hydroxybutyrate) depolymerase
LALNSGLPPLLVIQGSIDRVVRASNGLAAARLWAEATGARASAPRNVQRGTRRAMALTDFKLRGRVAATLCEVAGLGHAWSGGAASQSYGDPTGPDATRMVWSFATKQFTRATG